MNVEERMLLFSEQIMCGAEIYTWRYNANLEPLESNCPKAELLDATLHAFGGKEALRKLAGNMKKPLLFCETPRGSF